MATCMEKSSALLSGEGAWQREARRLVLLAAELNIELDSEALLLCDVHDVQTLRLRLRDALGRAARRPWATAGASGILVSPQAANPMTAPLGRLLSRKARR